MFFYDMFFRHVYNMYSDTKYNHVVWCAPTPTPTTTTPTTTPPPPPPHTHTHHPPPRTHTPHTQVGPDDLRLNALAELVTQIGKRDAFHQLRTVEQLGCGLLLCVVCCGCHECCHGQPEHAVRSGAAGVRGAPLPPPAGRRFWCCRCRCRLRWGSAGDAAGVLHVRWRCVPA